MSRFFEGYRARGEGWWYASRRRSSPMLHRRSSSNLPNARPWVAAPSLQRLYTSERAIEPLLALYRRMTA
jgi:hypothetical protein